MFEDIKACISASEYPGNHHNSKHADYRHQFVREGGSQRWYEASLYGNSEADRGHSYKVVGPEKFTKFLDVRVVSCSFLKIIKTRCWNTALTRAILEVIFEYMRACKLPKSGVYIVIYHQGHIYAVNPFSLGNCWCTYQISNSFFGQETTVWTTLLIKSP